MAWLITGGAGYIGAHVVRDMLSSGREVVVLDNLSTGSASRLPEGVPLVQGSVGDRDAVRAALELKGGVTGVLHFAALKQVGESVTDPLHYWAQNMGGLQVLLEEMVEADIRQMVFSSSAAVYGEPRFSGADEKITENTACTPINPYGATKLAGEFLVEGTAHAHRWKALSLRYFNVAGAGSNELGDPVALNLIPLILEAIEQGKRPQVFGDDYPTPDGTCIRDYIHVADLSAAHVAAVRVVESAYQAAHSPVTPSAAVRSAGEKMQQAASLAEQAASRLPGGARAVGAASQGTAAAEAAAEVAAKAVGRVPPAAKAMELASTHLPRAIRNTAPASGVRGQATEVVAEVTSQLGSLVARLAGVETPPKLVDHLALNIGSGRGYSVFEVIEAIRKSVDDPFAVDIVARRPGDPSALVASPTLANQLLGWKARRSLSDITDSAFAAWQHRK